MDLNGPKHIQSPPYVETPLERNKDDPFADTFTDPLCQLYLRETSEFVRSLPMATSSITENRAILSVSDQKRRESESSVMRRKLEAPSTPGRPVFRFSSRKNFPSKWVDAEKWLSSCNSSPARPPLSDSSKTFKPSINSSFAEKLRVEENVPKAVSSFTGSHLVRSDHHYQNLDGASNGVSASDILLKDEVQQISPNLRHSVSSKEGFAFKNSAVKDASTEVIQHRDIGTDMTPIGSSKTSRCHTPFKSSSPARHNTPANRSGPLEMTNSTKTIEISELRECHLAKLQLGSQFDSITSNWSSREEEEEEVSKSLRHFEAGNGYRMSVSESRGCDWEEEEKTKCCARYQREEAKIQAWVNLQNAKAEAQSRKLEVKIQRMRSNLEEKLMKKMAVVHRRAEEWRAAAQQQHSEQIQRATEQAQKKKMDNTSHFSSNTSCGCFPCSTHFV